jgi:DNA polymerase-1
VDEGCRIYSTNKADLAAPTDPHALLGEDKVRQKWGVPPGMIGDVLALIGDTVDNIPGIEGMGPKTAAALLNEHGSLDALLANLDRVKSERTREKLRAGVDQIRRNREMVSLHLDLPLPRPLEELSIAPRYPELVAALEGFEFKGLTAEVRAEGSAVGMVPQPAVGTPIPPEAAVEKMAKAGAGEPKQGELF